MRRGVAKVVVLGSLLTGLTACGQPGDGGYHLTAWFTKAVALYPQSHVKVMGLDVGRVTKVTVRDDAVQVDLLIDRKVPLPADVEATIVPFSLIGERNIVLSPAWQTGRERIADGATIPVERTHIPVEPDDALKAVTDLAKAIDPAAVSRLVLNGAAALDGNGAAINEALRQAGDLTAMLATQDAKLLKIAADAHAIASVLNDRTATLGKLLDDFAAVASELSSERSAVALFIKSLVALSETGKGLLTTYQIQLPKDLASLASVALTLQVNADSVQQLLQSLNKIGQGVIGAYDPVTGGVNLRITGSPTAMLALQQVFTFLGLGPAPCVSLGDVAC